MSKDVIALPPQSGQDTLSTRATALCPPSGRIINRRNNNTPLDFVIPGLRAGRLGMMVAAGGTGKSMLALQLGMWLAGGPDSLRMGSIAQGLWTPRGGRILYVSGEEDEVELDLRMASVMEGVDEQELTLMDGNFFPVHSVGLDLDLLDSDFVKELELLSYGCRLVILDTLRRFTKADENDAAAMSQVLKAVEGIAYRQKCAVLLLHHTSKSGALNNAGSQQAVRGSSVLSDNVRFQNNLVVMSEDEWTTSTHDAKELVGDRRFYVRMTFSKLNNIQPLSDVWFVRGPGGRLTQVACPMLSPEQAEDPWPPKKLGHKNTSQTPLPALSQSQLNGKGRVGDGDARTSESWGGCRDE